MKRMKRIALWFFALLAAVTLCASVTALAAGPEAAPIAVAEQGGLTTGAKAIAAAVAIGLAAAAGAIGMGIAVAKSVESISRQPEAENKIRTNLMLGLVFVETAIIYALIIAILIIFVL